MNVGDHSLWVVSYICGKRFMSKRTWNTGKEGTGQTKMGDFNG